MPRAARARVSTAEPRVAAAITGTRLARAAHSMDRISAAHLMISDDIADEDAPVDLEPVQAAFPDLPIRAARRDADLGHDALDYDAWNDEHLDLWALDRRIDVLAARGEALRLAAPRASLARFALEVLSRAQRRILQRNDASRGAHFDRVLEAHRALHDLDLPLVRADHDHALDAWQWTLRLDAEASIEVQLAALLHDIERLESEAVARIEQHAHDYRAFKEAHARRGAQLAGALLRDAGADAALAARVGALVARSERPDGSPEVAAVNDADVLSFFSLNSPGYLAYYGAERTRAKVDYTLERASPRAIAALVSVRLRPAIARMIEASVVHAHHGEPSHVYRATIRAQKSANSAGSTGGEV